MERETNRQKDREREDRERQKDKRERERERERERQTDRQTSTDKFTNLINIENMELLSYHYYISLLLSCIIHV